MAIQTAPAINGLIADRLLGADDFYTSLQMVIRTGNPPANIISSDSGTELVTIALPRNWGTFNGVSTLTLASPVADTTSATGKAGYWRLKGTNSATVYTLLQGTVSETGQGGDMQFPDVDWSSGLVCTLDTITITLPKTTTS